MNELKWETLHAHTDRSDGHQSYVEVLKTAEELGYSTVAFTDHDLVLDDKTLNLLRSYEGPVRWISGIEITSGMPKEIDATGSLHILGLFIDPTNKDLRQYAEEMQQSRLDRLNHYLKHLHSLGLQLTKDEVLTIADGSPVGSPHIVKAVYSRTENKQKIDAMMKEFEAAAETDEIARKQLEEMRAQGENQIPYRLFMTKRSFKPVPEGDYKRRVLGFDETVSLIHDAGGLAIFAHWFFEKEDIPKEQIEKLIKDGRIDGVETDVLNAITNHTYAEDVQFLESLVEQHGCLHTIGADSHSKEDLEVYAGSETANNSIGQTDTLIAESHVSTKWSNING